MRAAIVGATGVLGGNVLPRLIERGHAVRAVIRDSAKVARLERLGIETVKADILDPASLAPAIAGCDTVLNLATSVPRPGMPRDFALNDRIRREGTRHLVAACQSVGAAHLVQQSIAQVVAGGDTLLDETAPPGPSQTGASAVEMEAVIAAAPFGWTVLRGGAFYGPGNGRDEDWRGQARAGRLRLPGDGAAYVSLIHVADMAEAVLLTAEHGPAGLLAIVDDEPVTWRDFYRHLAAIEDGPEPPPGGPPGQPSFRVSNARARAVLGWAPRYATYRAGFV